MRYRPLDYVDVNLNMVSTEQEIMIKGLLKYLRDQDKEGNILLLYRGEQQENIHHRLFAGATGRDDLLPFDRLYLIGDKARFFSNEINPKTRNFLTDINGCSEETLTFIFERISNVLTTTRNRDRVLQNTSTGFRDFFLNRFNLNRFLDQVNSANSNEVIKIRDYYLYFLHGAGYSGIRDESMLVSTSMHKRIARGFSSYAGRYGRTNNIGTRLIFHYFIPRPYENFAVAPWLVDHHTNIVQANMLPSYKVHGLYPNQLEVAIKGALFPQFILGVELVGERRFIINPNIAYITEQDFFNISINGIPVDQSNFRSTIFDTGYIRWGEADGEGNFQQFEI